MTIAEAKSLLGNFRNGDRAERWFDLGSGSGTFTRALAEGLPHGSAITAVERARSAFGDLPRTHAGIAIDQQVTDMEQLVIPAPVDGILMANALHYVKDQRAFLQCILQRIVDDGTFLLVEYDTDRARPPWVPFPISGSRAKVLLAEAGFPEARHLGTRRSIHGPEMMYATAFRRAGK
ncbi:MAG TPA: methyltransferase domain-containing protein [Flavobacteriales bacterium]